MSGRLRTLALAVLLGGWPLLAAPPAGAAGAAGAAERPVQDMSGGGVPVSISADQMAYANREGKLVFSGNVQVVREGQTMRSDRLEVSLETTPKPGTGGTGTRGSGSAQRDVRRMVAEGNVIFTYGDRTAWAGRAEYDPAAATVVLTREPRLSDPRMQVVGEVITIDLNTQESTVQGGSFTYTEPARGTVAPSAQGRP